MKQLILFSITLGLLLHVSIGQTTARLDSVLSHRYDEETDDWYVYIRSVYDSQTPEWLTLIDHDRRDTRSSVLTWMPLCDDSIIDRSNYHAYYTMNYSTNQYVPIRQQQKTLYPDGKVHIHETMVGDSTGISWIPYSKTEFTYTSTGMVATEDVYSWDKDAQVYTPKEQFSFTYDAANRVRSKMATYTYSNNSFHHTDREDFEYNSDGQITAIDLFRMHNGSWVKRRHSVKSYSNEGNLIDEYSYLHYPNGVSWLIDSTSYKYDSKNRLTKKVIYASATSSQEVEPLWQYLHTYSAGGLTETVVSYLYVNELWVEQELDEYTKNVHGDLVKHYHRETSSTSYEFLDHYFYTRQPTDLSPRIESLCKLPNPLSANMPLACAALEPARRYQMSIYDLQGRLVVKEMVQQGEMLTMLSGLQRNLYVVQVSDGKNVLLSEKKLIHSK